MIKEFKKKNVWLSNFAPVEIEFQGKTYPSVEHAYMSAKSNEEKWKKFCADEDVSPGAVKKASRKVILRPDWDKIKKRVMYACLIQKFSQEPFKSRLLDTGDQNIQEGNYWGDKYWGICLKTYEGENHLGRMIMSIRSKLRKNEPDW